VQNPKRAKRGERVRLRVREGKRRNLNLYHIIFVARIKNLRLHVNFLVNFGWVSSNFGLSEEVIIWEEKGEDGVRVKERKEGIVC
jgi:hypothetical protein